MKNLHLFIAALALLCTQTALAHDDAYFDSIITPHGGQMRMAGLYHLELVVEDQRLTLYLGDHADQPINSAGASGTATVLSAGQRHLVNLQPLGDNRLGGQGEFAHDPQMRVVVNFSFPEQPAEQARFTPLAPRTIADDGTHDANHEAGHETGHKTERGHADRHHH